MFGEENEPNNNNWPRGCETLGGGGNEQTIRELFMSFFERGDQHQICGGSSKYVVLAFSVNQWNQEHECRGKY